MDNLYDIKYTNFDNEIVYLKRSPDLECGSYANDGFILNGYLVDCTDGETYLVFAPDEISIRYSPAFDKLMSMKQRDLINPELGPTVYHIQPAYTDEDQVLKGSWSYYGKIFRILPNRNYDDVIEKNA